MRIAAWRKALENRSHVYERDRRIAAAVGSVVTVTGVRPRRPARVDILETARFQDRHGATGYNVWVRVA